MKFSEFPHDMRVLIDQITEDAGVGYVDDDAEIPVGMVPTASFPARIQGHAAGDDRQFEDYLETPIEEYPPVLVAHGYWVDGRHRLWAARARGIQEIQTADISALVPRSYIEKARFLGKMRRPAGLSLSGPGNAFVSMKLDILKAATTFLYSKEGPDYGEFGGCGDTTKILIALSERLGLTGVELRYGNAYFPMEGIPGGDPNAHAWLLVDGKIFDPSQYVHGFPVIRYDAFDPSREGEFQSDLLECIVGMDEDEIESWADKTLGILQQKGLPDLDRNFQDVNRLFFISPEAPKHLQEFAADLIDYLYAPDKGAKIDEYGMWDMGNCWTLAQSLHDWIGSRSRMFWVAGRDPKRHLGALPQHVVLKLGNFYLDGNGLYTEKELLSWWEDLEQFVDLSIKPFSEKEAISYSIHCRAIDHDQLVADFRKYLERP